jgi:cobalt/nickel transport system permease protein
MSDSLLSLPVAAATWTITVGALAKASRHAAEDPRATPARMGALGAFVFAAQMINFSIPGTGSSGHFAGGTLLTLLLGPWAASLVMASVLAMQALFFADGGLLAWGANVMNLGLIPAFIAVPWVYRSLGPEKAGPGRRHLAVLAATLTACIGGALAVTVETTASGISELPFTRFALLMVSVHAVIGLVEGFITVAVLEQLPAWSRSNVSESRSERRTLLGLGLSVALVAGVLSWFASTRPDGLEYSLEKSGTKPAATSLAQKTEAWQRNFAPLPDYGFRSKEEDSPTAAWPAVEPGTSAAGLLGAAVVAGVALGLGSLLARRRPGEP